MIRVQKGDRIAIHPASDFYMRGIKYATVVSVGRKYIHCQTDHVGMRFKLNPRNVLEVVRL